MKIAINLIILCWFLYCKSDKPKKNELSIDFKNTVRKSKDSGNKIKSFNYEENLHNQRNYSHRKNKINFNKKDVGECEHTFFLSYRNLKNVNKAFRKSFSYKNLITDAYSSSGLIYNLVRLQSDADKKKDSFYRIRTLIRKLFTSDPLGTIAVKSIENLNIENLAYAIMFIDDQYNIKNAILFAKYLIDKGFLYEEIIEIFKQNKNLLKQKQLKKNTINFLNVDLIVNKLKSKDNTISSKDLKLSILKYLKNSFKTEEGKIFKLVNDFLEDRNFKFYLYGKKQLVQLILMSYIARIATPRNINKLKKALKPILKDKISLFEDEYNKKDLSNIEEKIKQINSGDEKEEISNADLLYYKQKRLTTVYDKLSVKFEIAKYKGHVFSDCVESVLLTLLNIGIFETSNYELGVQTDKNLFLKSEFLKKLKTNNSKCYMALKDFYLNNLDNFKTKQNQKIHNAWALILCNKEKEGFKYRYPENSNIKDYNIKGNMENVTNGLKYLLGLDRNDKSNLKLRKVWDIGEKKPSTIKMSNEEIMEAYAKFLGPKWIVKKKTDYEYTFSKESPKQNYDEEDEDEQDEKDYDNIFKIETDETGTHADVEISLSEDSTKPNKIKFSNLNEGLTFHNCFTNIRDLNASILDEISLIILKKIILNNPICKLKNILHAMKLKKILLRKKNKNELDNHKINFLNDVLKSTKIYLDNIAKNGDRNIEMLVQLIIDDIENKKNKQRRIIKNWKISDLNIPLNFYKYRFRNCEFINTTFDYADFYYCIIENNIDGNNCLFKSCKFQNLLKSEILYFEDCNFEDSIFSNIKENFEFKTCFFKKSLFSNIYAKIYFYRTTFDLIEFKNIYSNDLRFQKCIGIVKLIPEIKENLSLSLMFNANNLKIKIPKSNKNIKIKYVAISTKDKYPTIIYY